MKIGIFSDLHLGNVPSEGNRLFIATLRQLRSEKITHLWLLGDIFDLLIGPYTFWERIHEEIFVELRALAAQGTQILWLEGNHDFHLGRVAKGLAIDLRDGVQKFRIDNKSVHLAHGDLVNTDDKKYLRWRRVTRSPLFRALLSVVPSDLAEWCLLPRAENASKRSRHRNAGASPELKELYRAYADAEFSRGADAVFLGHCHVADLYEVGAKFYLNLGSWLGPDKMFAVWEPGTAPALRNAASLPAEGSRKL